MLENRYLIYTAGFPRSGNHFLNYAINLLYYPEFPNQPVQHSIWVFRDSMLARARCFAPFRHPLDCISSWDTHKISISMERDLDKDIEEYINFNTYVLQNFSRVTSLDFDKFTVDIEYIKERILTRSDIEPVASTTVEEVTAKMVAENRNAHLPRVYEDELEEAKAYILSHPRYQECLDIYEELKAQS
jgi:hypothetical protein